MNDRDRKDNSKGPEKKRPVKSGFNLVFTLLFVVFMAMLMLTLFGDNPLKNAQEIGPLTFKKLLYTCRIATLEVGYEQVEGEYIRDPDHPDRAAYSGNLDEEPINTNRRIFTMEISPDGLLELTPDYDMYVGKKVENGSPSSLLSSLVDDRISVQSYHTVTFLTSDVRDRQKSRAGEDEYAGASTGFSGSELFVDFFDQDNTARFARYVFEPGSASTRSDSNLQAILASLRKQFPSAQYKHFPVQDEGSLNYNRPNTFWTTIFAPLIPWILIIGLLWFFIIRQMRMGGGGGNVLSFGRSRATLVNKEHTKETFDDVAGIEEAKEEVKEIVEFLRSPGKFTRLGGRIPSGVLLVGSPGTGKTLLAKAIAGEADVPFFSICGSDFVEMFVGVGASRVRDLFRQARESSPCLIFLDEIDAVGRKRGSGLGGGHDEREQTLNAILVEMDGFEKDEGIIMLAATNRPDVLDPALLRPGRFDREIVIDLPDLRGREAILKVHCRKIKISESVNLSIIARGTPGFSGAELAALVNEAALIATMRERAAVQLADLEEARDKIRWGRQKKSRFMEDEDRLITAYHESGHALVANLLPEAEELHKVTIIPRGAALGATMVLPEKDRYHYRKKELIANIKVLYAGRIAEDLFCGDLSGGAKNDIERATEIARVMVCQLGMSEEVGPVSYGEQSDHVFLGEELVRAKTYSDDMAQKIDESVRDILDTCYQETTKIIGEHKEVLEQITQALMKYETVTGQEVALIVSGKSIDEIEFENAPIPTPPPKAEEPVQEKPSREEAQTDVDPGDLPTAGEPAY